MGLALFYQVSRELTLGEQGIGGDGSAFDRNGIEHRRGHLDLVGLFFFVTAGYRQGADFFWV